MKSKPTENNLIKIISDIETELQSESDKVDIILSNINEIKPHPYNNQIYEPFDNEDDKLKNDFIGSIEKYGVLEPIVINENNEIISGHRRYSASIFLGIETIPTRTLKFENDILAIIHFNKQREKNGTIIKNEFSELEKNLFKKLGGSGKKKNRDGIDIYNTISNLFNISRGSATKLYRVFKEDKELFTKIKIPQNPNGTISIDKAYFSLKTVKSKSKVVTEKNYIKSIKSSLPNINVNELFDLLESTYPYSLMVNLNRDSDFKNVTFDNTKFIELDNKRKELIDDLEFKKNLTTQELLMFEKFDEVSQTSISNEIKKKVFDSLWKPTDIEDVESTVMEIENLKPKLILSNDKNFFNALRIFTHSLSWNQNVGRNLKYLVIDEPTQKILGSIVVGSDVMYIEVRDKLIGWDNESKISNKKLNHIGMVTTILPTFILGFNFLGTKLIAYLSQSSTIQKDWKERYGDILVGLTTTSLYGSFSSYNGVPNWKKCGLTSGKIILNPSKVIYKYWLQWLKENHREDYNKSFLTENNNIQTGPKQKVLNSIFKYLNLKQSNYHHLNQKGVYFHSIYT